MTTSSPKVPDHDFAAAVERYGRASHMEGALQAVLFNQRERIAEAQAESEAARAALLAQFEEMRAENERLRTALNDLCDAWDDRDGGGRFKGNITNAHTAARSALHPSPRGCAQPTTEGR